MATTKTLAPTNQTITIDAFQGEKPDHRHVADAEGKLADAINELNNHIEAHWFGNNTLANIQTAIVSFAQNVPDGGVRSIEFGISQATGSFGATNYIGKLERISGSRLCVTVMNAMYSTNMVIGNYKDGTWNWAEVALNSQLVKTVKVTYTPSNNLAAGESGYFTVPVPAELRGKAIVAVSFGINHVAQSYGYQLTGTYISTLDSAYVSYYSPRAITAANADFDMIVAYI